MIPKLPQLFRAFCVLAFVLTAPSVMAEPTRYELDKTASQVGFIYSLSGADQKGTMPVASAVLMIDPDNLATSAVDVYLDVQNARTGLIFATDALKSPSVLDANQFPTLHFVSTTIRLGANGRLSEGAEIDGNVTLRGVTRPITLQAGLFRLQGSAIDDLSHLTVRLTGSINRAEFGANGFGELVGDSVRLDIVAHIKAQQ
jgi:polyisoprenoid-binding protein YceI